MTNARAGLLGLVALALLSALLVLGVALLLHAASPSPYPRVPARWRAPTASPSASQSVVLMQGEGAPAWR